MDTDEEMQQRAGEDEQFRDRLLNWLNANNINPHTVPASERPTIADGQITLRLMVCGVNGVPQVDPLSNTVLTRTVTLPVIVEPDGTVQEWLKPRCSGCGR